MKKQLPHNFEFHKYLQKIVAADQPAANWFMATEKDFEKGSGIDYPYRSYFYVTALMHKGNCKIKIGIKEYELKNQSLSVVGPGIVRNWISNDWKTKNHTFLFKPEFFKKPFYDNFLIEYPFFKPGAAHVIQLLDTDYKKACSLISEIEKNSENKKILQGLFYAYFELINDIYSVVNQGVSNSSRNMNIASQFSHLLHKHFQQQKEVSFYADSLHLSAKNLSEILSKETGKSAKLIIEEFILFEAKSMLKQTNVSIKEIVYWLGYEDPSYFTKIFKSKEGVTPLQYRGS